MSDMVYQEGRFYVKFNDVNVQMNNKSESTYRCLNGTYFPTARSPKTTILMVFEADMIEAKKFLESFTRCYCLARLFIYCWMERS